MERVIIDLMKFFDPQVLTLVAIFFIYVKLNASLKITNHKIDCCNNSIEKVTLAQDKLRDNQ